MSHHMRYNCRKTVWQLNTECAQRVVRLGAYRGRNAGCAFQKNFNNGGHAAHARKELVYTAA